MAVSHGHVARYKSRIDVAEMKTFTTLNLIYIPGPKRNIY
jgi:hypothetical protein